MSNGNHTTAGAAPAWRPAREVEMFVGTPPGGGQDRPARTLLRIMADAGIVDVPMKITNIAGKGGGNAWDALRARAGDGHALSISASPLLNNRILGVSDFDHDGCTPLANLYSEYLAFIVGADSALKSARDLLDQIKADPAALTVALATAVGSTNHLAMGKIVQHLGGDPRKLQLRVFESALYAVDDVLAGNAPLGVISSVSARKALAEGQARVLAVSSPARLAGAFAAAPTWQELAIPCVMGQWRGVLGAPGISAAEVAYWEHAFATAISHAEWQAELAANSWSDQFLTGAALRVFLDEERALAAGLLRALGLVGAG
jgi:putative tricarboxylic transport membrane protein